MGHSKDLGAIAAEQIFGDQGIGFGDEYEKGKKKAQEIRRMRRERRKAKRVKRGYEDSSYFVLFGLNKKEEEKIVELEICIHGIYRKGIHITYYLCNK